MKVDRRTFLAGMGAAAAGGWLPRAMAAESRAVGSNAPNVLFLAVDDLRPQLGCYGHAMMQTPNIDRLAASGVRFERAYCNVPVCGASRASLLTGLRPTPKRFLGYDTRKDKDAPHTRSLPAHLKANGYQTYSFGKIYHAGNDDLEAWTEKPWRSYRHADKQWIGPGYLSPENVAVVRARRAKAGSKSWRVSRAAATEAADVPDNAYPDGVIADKAIKKLRSWKDASTPFFLGCGFLKPHLPFNAPKRYWDLYRREEIDLADNPFRPKGAPDVALHNWGELRNYTDIPRKGPLSEAKARELIHGYYACASYTDAQVGRVLDALEELGLADNTVVILWGDHGWNLGEHGLWCKHCNFHTSLHTPLLLRVPGGKPGVVCDELVEFVDIYPTLADLCGLPVPAHCEGMSMTPLLGGGSVPWKDAVFSRYYKGDTIVTKQYLYTRYRKQNGRGDVIGEMLYDHAVDPGENVNVADRSQYAEVVADLRRRLEAFQ